MNSGFATGQANQPKNAVEQKPSINAQLDEIDCRINSLRDCQNQIGQAVCRLLNPRPAEACRADAEKTPVPNTVESRLQGVVRSLDSLLGDLSDNAASLNRAI